MKKIRLTQKKCALVDDKDFKWLNQWNWYAALDKKAGRFYAVRADHSSGKQLTIRLHRLIMNPSKGMEIDHKDGNGLNCQRNNLRLATKSQNMMNRVANKHSTSKFKGVSWNKHSKKWEVKIKNIYIGLFRIEHQAAIAYDLWAKDLFGEYAKLNF